MFTSRLLLSVLHISHSRPRVCSDLYYHPYSNCSSLYYCNTQATSPSTFSYCVIRVPVGRVDNAVDSRHGLPAWRRPDCYGTTATAPDSSRPYQRHCQRGRCSAAGGLRRLDQHEPTRCQSHDAGDQPAGHGQHPADPDRYTIAHGKHLACQSHEFGSSRLRVSHA
jgi:hypothetical protein